MRSNVIKAKEHLKKAREIISRRKSKSSHLSEAAVIAKIRKDRTKIWESKFAARS